MFAAIVLLFFVPAYIDSRVAEKIVVAPYATGHRVFFWGFIGVFLTLMFLGTRAAAEPYVHASKLFTVLYFLYFLVVLPTLTFYSSQLVKESSTVNR